jgi:energy-coupling factor transporter ATP-binding protein EcfA2
MSSELAPRIARIRIRSLFGTFNYDLPANLNDSLSDMAILYGDNGSGKTTILQLVYHLLSPADDRRHRGAIAQIPFRVIEVTLTNGRVFAAVRELDTIVGDYALVTYSDSSSHVICYYSTKLQSRVYPEEKWKEYQKILQSQGMLVFFLADDREIHSDMFPSRHDSESFSASTPLNEYIQARDSRPDQSLLNQAVNLVNQWFARQAARGANAGDTNVNTIYTEIVRRLSQQEASPEAILGRHAITQTIQELAARSEKFAKFRLLTSLKSDFLIESLKTAPESAIGSIARVLQPFFAGTKARLDALEGVQHIAEVFVESFAEFYSHKTVVFDVVDGLRFKSNAGAFLLPSQLSSGERQLLRLFCYTLVSRDCPSVFIIDEPELSLNIKWQRKLIRALKAIVAGSSNQFLFATHSIEILSQHRDAIVTLTQVEN